MADSEPIQRDLTVHERHVLIDNCNPGSTTLKLLLMTLFSFYGGDGLVVPRMQLIAARMGCDRSTAKRNIRKLEEKGLITVVPQRRSDGSARSNRYVFNWEAIEQHQFAEQVRFKIGGADCPHPGADCPEVGAPMPRGGGADAPGVGAPVPRGGGADAPPLTPPEYEYENSDVKQTGGGLAASAAAARLLKVIGNRSECRPLVEQIADAELTERFELSDWTGMRPRARELAGAPP